MLFGTAAILAGGKSTRMGFDKQLLTANEQKILSTVTDTLKREFPDILIVTARPELYAGMDVRLCGDEYLDMGPLAGIQAALMHARSRYVYLLACDMPIVNLPYIRHMKERIQREGADICFARRNGQAEPFNAFYSRGLLEDISARLERGSGSLFRFISASNPCVIEEAEARRFDKDLKMFTNINTRSDYDAFLRSIV